MATRSHSSTRILSTNPLLKLTTVKVPLILTPIRLPPLLHTRITFKTQTINTTNRLLQHILMPLKLTSLPLLLLLLLLLPDPVLSIGSLSSGSSLRS